MDIIKVLASELNIKTSQVEATIKLIDEGCTIPFIARYRKEVTGSLDDEILRKFDEYTSAQGFKIKTATDGIYFSPIYNGNVLNENEFNALDEKVKEEFKAKSPKIQEETLVIMKKLEELDKECNFKVASWQANMITYVVSKNINDLKIKYKGDLKIQNFFYAVQEDVVKNAEQDRDQVERE